MRNNQFISILKQLKDEGISYKKLAEELKIPYSSFYYYLRNNKFPFDKRAIAETYILNKYGELLDYE